MKRSNQDARLLQSLIREPYAWPGGYPRYALCDDGETLCHKCCRANYRLIREDQKSGASTGWAVTAVGINWEDRDMYCANCSERIEPAYEEENRYASN